MRLLLDESVPRRLATHLRNHEVKTVVQVGWGGAKNGALLSLAAREFDVFITVDKNLSYQQNLATLPLAVVVLRAKSNELQNLIPLIPELNLALSRLQPGDIVVIGTLAS
jgi:predicted nuclease of predicted toxin-antitoxin system